MNKKLLLPTIVMCLVLGSACSKLVQDPLSDKAPTVKDFSEKPTQPVPSVPIASDAVHIDAVDWISVEVSKPCEFDIGVRILLANYKAEISFDNLSDFPGAQFDPVKGVFHWTPGSDVIPAGELRADRILQVKAVAQKPNDNGLINTKEIHIQITRALHVPSIVSIQGPTDGLREGDSGSIKVRVQDDDGGIDPKTFPVLNIRNTPNVGSFSAFAEVYQVNYVSPGLYDFNIYVDLTHAELVASTTYLGATLQVSSQFGKLSATQDMQLQIKNLLGLAESTWTSPISAKAGALIDHQFMIFDPKKEGQIQSITFANLPTGAQATCTTQASWIWDCRFQWQTTATTPVKSYSFTANFVMKNSGFGDTQTRTQTFSFDVGVQK